MSKSTPTSAATETVPDLDLSGRQIGDYRLLRRLGRGAMAEVYLAEQISLRRQVAFKILKRELAKDATYVRRFQMEAQAAAALVHAHIVQIHEVGCIDGVQYIAQEYVAGQNLRELLTRRGLPDVKLVVAIMRQVAAALAKAADQGIVHRDIKPENIMLTKAGEVKVADFGLARITGEGDSLALTQTGMTMGTPLYMSPEQVEGRALDPRSDIYSFGVTCYQMLAGEPPFRGETALSVAVHHVKTLPPRLENRRTDLPPGLCRIVHKMLAKDPKDRYPDARELLRDLRSLEIEGLTGDWPAELDERNTIEAAALGHSPLDGTRRLDTLMRTQALAIHDDRRFRRRLALVLAAAFLIGGTSALLLRRSFLLDTRAAAAPSNGIPDKGSPVEQYLYAREAGPELAEAAWNSVADFYPEDDVYTPLAKQQLARYYLERDRYDDALKIYDWFAEDDEVDQYRAFGLAGECVVYFVEATEEEQKNPAKAAVLKAKSAKSEADLSKLAGGLEPARLDKLLKDRDMVQAIGKVQVLHRDPKKSDEWNKWLESHFHDDPTPPTTQ
jgi:eukaryotic-like serine/threonine-protein kinase